MKIEIESFYHGDISLLDVGAEHVTIREAYGRKEGAQQLKQLIETLEDDFEVADWVQMDYIGKKD